MLRGDLNGADYVSDISQVNDISGRLWAIMLFIQTWQLSSCQLATYWHYRWHLALVPWISVWVQSLTFAEYSFKNDPTHLVLRSKWGLDQRWLCKASTHTVYCHLRMSMIRKMETIITEKCWFIHNLFCKNHIWATSTVWMRMQRHAELANYTKMDGIDSDLSHPGRKLF